jgi:D-sedoheptulose 7-phosphate isomerase
MVDSYRKRLLQVLQNDLPENISVLCSSLEVAGKNNRNVFVCGNGGSAANAEHIVNDMVLYTGNQVDGAVSAESLVSNGATLTCVANDFSYDDVFLRQLKVKAKSGDLLLVLSGSGNSENVVKAIDYGNKIGMETFAVLGFDGGKCKKIATYSIHFSVNDMQVSEDLQLVVGHMCMKYLKQNTLEKT